MSAFQSHLFSLNLMRIWPSSPHQSLIVSPGGIADCSHSFFSIGLVLQLVSLEACLARKLGLIAAAHDCVAQHGRSSAQRRGVAAYTTGFIAYSSALPQCLAYCLPLRYSPTTFRVPGDVSPPPGRIIDPTLWVCSSEVKP